MFYSLRAYVEDVNIILPCGYSLGFIGFKVHEEGSCPCGVNIYYEPLNGEDPSK